MTSEHPEEWEPLEEQLREKIKEWREIYEAYDNDPSKIPNGGHQMRCKQLNECADEIEELIE